MTRIVIARVIDHEFGVFDRIRDAHETFVQQTVGEFNDIHHFCTDFCVALATRFVVETVLCAAMPATFECFEHLHLHTSMGEGVE